MNLKGCFLHNSDDWSTPEDIYKHFIDDLKCIDPCPLYCKSDNTYNIFMNTNIYINPPYSKIKDWVRFIFNNTGFGCDNTIYLLIPARTDTKYFHELMNMSNTKELYFIKGRLKFGNSKYGAPFPSVLIKFYSGINIIKKTIFIDRNEVLLIDNNR